MKAIKNTIAGLAIIAATLLCYSNTLNHPYVYDDLIYIAGNKTLSDTANMRLLFSKKYFKLSGERSFRPVSTAFMMAEHKAGNGDPKAFRIGSIAAIAAASLMAFLFMLAATGRADIAFFTALIYACHPILTESVNGSSFIEDPLSTALLFAALFVHAGFRRGVSILAPAALFVLSLAAMLAKESAAVIPAIIIVFEATLGGINPPLSDRRRNTMALASIAALAVFILLRFAIFVNPSPSAAATMPGGSLSSAFSIVSMAFLKYLQLFFMPRGFSVEGCVELTRKFVETKMVVSILLHAGLLAAAIALRKTNRLFTFSALYYLVSLLPVSNIIPFGASMAERYMCAPAFGLAALFVCCFLCQDGDARPESAPQSPRARAAFILFLSCAAVFLASATVERNKTWASSLLLWQDAVDSCPDSTRARNNFGRGLMEARRFEDAADQFKIAVRLDPKNYEAWNSLGAACIHLSDFKCANNALREAYRISPSDDVRYNFVLYYMASGRHLTAISILQSMLRHNPGWAEGKYLLGAAYLKRGDHATAEPLLREAVKLDPKNISALGNLGILLLETGKRDEAKQMFEMILKTDPENKVAKNRLIELNAKAISNKQ